MKPKTSARVVKGTWAIEFTSGDGPYLLGEIYRPPWVETFPSKERAAYEITNKGLIGARPVPIEIRITVKK